MLETGLTFTKTELVTEKNSAAAMGSGMLPVYATPAMILLIEAAAAELAAPHLDEGCTTVGTKLDVEHLAATPIGMEVRAVVTLAEIDRRRLVYDVEVSDKAGLIGKGRHERFIVAADKFMAKAQAKLEL